MAQELWSIPKPYNPMPEFFEFRLFHIRIQGCDIDLSPPCLTLCYVVYEPYQHLEINSTKSNNWLGYGWSGSMPLHQTRIDQEGSAVTYASIDCVKINEYGVECEIFDGDLAVALASLGMWWCDLKAMQEMGLETDMILKPRFTLQLCPQLPLPEFIKRKEGVSVHPSMEVYMTGCCGDDVPEAITRTKPIIYDSEKVT
ncbi:uncharacterized protein LOC115673968 [Syzygium oleosum]|uniref:uncharacterized protein LOC115673968 n=1 Tax=Syzygium oleosum TaxID=219896 RepID=UPI0011D1B3EE|nr:uncharacterized protein LOC115673968 [Syzygium oleosum]